MHEVPPDGQAPSCCSLQGEGMERVGDLKLYICLCVSVYNTSQIAMRASNHGR